MRSGLLYGDCFVSVFRFHVYQVRPEAAEKWRGLPSKSEVFPVEADRNLILKYTNMVFCLSCIIGRFNGEKTAKRKKSRPSLVRWTDSIM